MYVLRLLEAMAPGGSSSLDSSEVRSGRELPGRPKGLACLRTGTGLFPGHQAEAMEGSGKELPRDSAHEHRRTGREKHPKRLCGADRWVQLRSVGQSGQQQGTEQWVLRGHKVTAGPNEVPGGQRADL